MFSRPRQFLLVFSSFVFASCFKIRSKKIRVYLTVGKFDKYTVKLYVLFILISMHTHFIHIDLKIQFTYRTVPLLTFFHNLLYIKSPRKGKVGIKEIRIAAGSSKDIPTKTIECHVGRNSNVTFS